MNPILIIAVLVVVAVVVLVAWLVVQRRRAEALRSQFGSEYDRTVEASGSRRAAEQQLEERRERVSTFELRPLSPGDQARYADAWKTVQREFVDDPGDAVRKADRLIQEVLDRRGYPVADFDTRVADLSVDHADVVGHYRAAHELIGGDDGPVPTDTEALRQAMVHYRALFASVLADGGDQQDEAAPAATTRRAS